MSVAARLPRRKNAEPDPADLLAWYDRHRRVMPWRARKGQRTEPYAVWLSEIMLQQTTVKTVGPYFEKLLAGFVDHPLVGNVRSKGLLAGVEIVASKKTKRKFDPQLGLSGLLAKTGYDNGLIFRAFGDGTVGFAPPLCCTNDDIDLLMARFRKTLDQVLAMKEVRNALDGL